MDVAENNLNHALANDCHDPDCEIHVPSVIEDRNERLTAMAWYYAGACALLETLDKVDHRDEALPLLTYTLKEVSQ